MSKIQSHNEENFKVPKGFFEEKLRDLKRDMQVSETNSSFKMPSNYLDNAKAEIQSKVRTETPVRPLWIRYAVAAAILLIGGLVWWNASSDPIDEQRDWLAHMNSEDLNIEWFELDDLEDLEVTELDLMDVVEINNEDLEAYFLEEDWETDELAELYLTH